MGVNRLDTWGKSGQAQLLAGLAVGNALLLAPNRDLHVLGGALLFCVMPGLALMDLVFPRPGRLNLWARLLLGVAASYVASNLGVQVLAVLPGRLTPLGLAAVLDVLSLLLIVGSVVRHTWVPGGCDDRPASSWSYVLVLLALVGLFRFAALGSTEFVAIDEVHLASMATRYIEGQPPLLSEHEKGPPEITTAAAFVLFDNGHREGAMRLPFALAGAASVLLLYVLGREMFSERVGFLATVLMALEGTYLALSRSAKYQSIVMLMALASVYCLWRAGTGKDERLRASFLIVGSAFFAFGCLTHYDAIGVFPVLVVLYVAQVRQSWRREIGLAIACAVVILAIAGPFYVPFVFDQRLSGTRSYIGSGRLGLGHGIYSNFHAFVILEMIFRNSVYYVAFMLLGLFGAIVARARGWDALHRRLTSLAWVSLAFGLAISIGIPGWMRIGNVNWALVLMVPAALVALLDRGLSREIRVVWLWFLVILIGYGFMTKTPGLHWYGILPSWSLLGAMTCDRAFEFIERKARPSMRRWIWLPVGILISLFGGYTYLLFLQQDPEYALSFPEHQIPLYWMPSRELPWGTDYYIPADGAPHQTGWKAIGYLYRTGVLRGHLRVSSARDALEWYLGQPWDSDDTSEYVLYRAGLGPSWPDETLASGLHPTAIGQWYDLVGRVMVNKTPRVLIYRRKETAGSRSPVRDYDYEEYGPLYDRLVSLDEKLRRDEVETDSKTYFQAAEFVRATSNSGDVVLFTDPRQVGPFSYHYSGDLAYDAPSGLRSPADVDQWLSAHSKAKAYIVLWSAAEGDERRAWDAWLDENAVLREHAWQGNVGIAVYDPRSDSGPHLLQKASLGDSVGLFAYALSHNRLKKTVIIDLWWTAGKQPTADYTVFTHLVDSNGRMIGQQDSPPDGDKQPTSLWRTDKVIRDEHVIPLPETAAGEYWVEVGMYRPATGERLPSNGQGMQPDGRIRLPQPAVVRDATGAR